MHCIALVQATPSSPDIAVLQLETKEHEAFHNDPVGFVNRNHVFRKSVNKVEVVPHASTATGILVIVHLPGCACAAYCGGT